MTIDIINEVLDEFVKRLQIPECNYSFAVNSNENLTELIIMVDGVMKTSISIGNGTMRVIYNDDYSSDDYLILNFLTPVTMIYYVCVLFYKSIHDTNDIDFNDILSIVFLNEIWDWKTLLQGLSENLGMSFIDYDKYVEIEGVEIHYNGFVNQIRIDTQDIKLQDNNYTTIVEAMFKCVEYIANIMDVADNLFKAEEEVEESNVIEEEGEETGGGGGPETNLDLDVNVPEEGGGEEAEPVETVEMETFEEPQGPVVTMDEVL